MHNRRGRVLGPLVDNPESTNHKRLALLVRRHVYGLEILPVHRCYDPRMIRKTATSYRRFGGLDKVPPMIATR
jgi:hypothetical protein